VQYDLAFANGNVYSMASSASRIVARLQTVNVTIGVSSRIDLYMGATADSHISLPSNTVDASTFVPYTGAVQDLNLNSHGLTLAGTANFAGAVHTLPTIVVANVGALPASGCTPGELAVVTAATAGQQIYENSGTGTCTWTQQAGPGASQLHSISFTIDGGGSAIPTGPVNMFPTAAFACTINRVNISADQTGTITVDIWKAAGAIPTGGDLISAAAPLTLSGAQLAQNGSLAGWSTSVSVGDVFGFSVATANTVTKVVGQIWCN